MKPKLEIASIPKTTPRTHLSHSTAYRLGQLMSLDEPSYQSLVAGVENDPLFKKLFQPHDRSPSVISRKRSESPFTTALTQNTRTNQSQQNYSQTIPPTVKLINLLKNLGEQKFRSHFLENSHRLNLDQRALLLNLSHDEVSSLETLAHHLHMKTLPPGTPRSTHRSSVGSKTAHLIAAIFSVPKKPLSIQWLSHHYTQGPYIINHRALKNFETHHTHTQDEKQRLQELLAQIKLINYRQNFLKRLVEALLKKQRRFIRSSQWPHLKALTQRELAKDLIASTSTISRLLKNRALIDPKGDILPLSSLAPSRADLISLHLQDILERKPHLTNSELAKRLTRRLKSPISSRLIYNYRHRAT